VREEKGEILYALLAGMKVACVSLRPRRRAVSLNLGGFKERAIIFLFSLQE